MATDTTAIVHAKLHPMTDAGVIDDGSLVLNGSTIVSVGPDVSIPDDSTVIDAEGRPVTPGLVDAHSHSGVLEWGAPRDADEDETTDTITPEVRVLDGFNPGDEGLQRAIDGGVTSIGAMMGSANVVGGLVCSMKTSGTIADDMLIGENGLKAALGQNPKGVGAYDNQDVGPDSRPGIAAKLRQTFIDGEAYLEERHREQDHGRPSTRDLGMEHVGRVLSGEISLRVHAHRADDIMTAFRIADEFDIEKLVIEHATEGHKVADEFAKRDVAAVVGPNMVSAQKAELAELSVETAGVLSQNGVPVAIQSDAPILPQEHLRVYAGLGTRGDLSKREALSAITAQAAEILDIDDRVGTLEPDTDADVVIWSGPVFDLETRPTNVFVDGDEVLA